MKEIYGLGHSLYNNYHATTDTTLIIKSEGKSLKKMAENFFVIIIYGLHAF